MDIQHGEHNSDTMKNLQQIQTDNIVTNSQNRSSSTILPTTIKVSIFLTCIFIIQGVSLIRFIKRVL